MNLVTTPFVMLCRIALFVVFFLLAHQAAANTLTATVDRNTIKSDETFNLTLTFDASTNQAPDISDINTHFDVLTNRQSSSTRYINGSINSSTKWTYSLKPKSNGKLMIPSFNFEGSVSDAIVINVEEPNYQQSNAGEDIFFETTINKDNVYVQEQLILTYKLFHKVNFDVVSHTLEQLDLPSTIYEPLENTGYQTTIQNERYQVQEIRYAFYAQASGSLEIPSIKWVFRTRVNNSSRYGISRIQTDAKQIKVKSIPASYPAGATWLPSSEIKLVEQWSQDFSQITLGEPATRTLQLQASGLMAAQLPELTLKSQSNNYSVYPEAPVTDQKILATGINSIRQEISAIVINTAGNISLSEVAIPWWNTQTDSLEYARINAKTVQVQDTNNTRQTQLGSQSGSQSGSQPNPSSQTNNLLNNGKANSQTTVVEYKTPFIWPVISGVLLILSGIFFILWWQAKQSLTTKASTHNGLTQQQQKASLTFTHLINTCRTNNAVQTKKALQKWGEAHLNGAQSLAAIGAQIQSPEVFDALQALDAHLYKPQGNSNQPTTWQGEDLAIALENWQATQKTKQDNSDLPPLYPV